MSFELIKAVLAFCIAACFGGVLKLKNAKSEKNEMSTIQVHEVCKVRNAAVGRAGSGYSLAVFKKANKASARVIVLDA